MKRLNGYRVFYGTVDFDTVSCGSCGYEWIYDLYDDYCPRCGARI